MPDEVKIRRSVIAGSWYPGTPDVLEGTICRYLERVEPFDLGDEPVGIIVPHAGYMYSGQVAAHAYSQLVGKSYERVAVVSPIHRMSVGRYAVVDADFYETPLGLVEIDRAAVEALGARLPLQAVERDNEHSLEIQLPFLQYTLSEFKLLPIMMGDQSLASCRALSEALVEVLGSSRALLVASTDLSHFHSYSRALELDRIVQKRIADFDPEGLAASLSRGECEACGGGPVVAVMLAAREMGANRAAILHYSNSGDVTGERSQVVGYLAGVLYRQGN